MSNGKPSHVRWFLVFWLFILSSVAFLDRVNIAIAGADIAAAYHLSDVQLGSVFSAFLFGYALFQTVGGWLADRLGPRRVLTVGVVWWGIFTALTAALPVGVPHALLLLVTIRFLFGAGEAVIFPASNQFVARWIPLNERGLANGLIFAGVGVGAGLTPPLVTYVVVHHGWRSSFWLCALIGLAAGAVWFLVARDTPEEHPRVSASEMDRIRAGLNAASGKDEISARQTFVPWRIVLKSKEVWALTVSYFSFGYLAWIFFSWFYIYLAKVRGLNLKASAFYAMLPFLAMAVCSALGGLLSDHLTRRRGPRVGRCLLAASAIAIAGIFVAFGSQVHSAGVASVILAGGAGALYVAQSSFWSVSADISRASSGSVSGFMNMGAQIGGAVTTLLTPAIASWFGWTASFLVAAGLCGLGAIAWLFVDPRRVLAATLNSYQGDTTTTALPAETEY